MALSDMEHLCLEVVRMVFTSSGDLAVSRRTPSWPWRSGAKLELQRKQYQALFFSSKCTSSMSRLVFRTSKVICFPSPSAPNAAKSICFNVVVASVNTKISWFCNWHVKLKTLQGTISHKFYQTLHRRKNCLRHAQKFPWQIRPDWQIGHTWTKCEDLYFPTYAGSHYYLHHWSLMTALTRCWLLWQLE